MNHLQQLRRNPLATVQHALDKAMNEFSHFFETPAFPRIFEQHAICPFVDIVEDNENFKVEVEAPGMGEADMHVSINNNVLTIKGEKKISRKDKDKNYVTREIGYGCYERTIALPDFLDTDKAKASFKKGMLWINIPKKPEFAKSGRELKIEKAQE